MSPSYPGDPAAGDVAKPGVIPLRPLGVGDILSGAFATIRTRPLLMLGVTFVVVVVAELINLAVTSPLLDDLTALPPIDASTPPERMFDGLGSSLAITGIGFVIIVVVRVLLSGFVTVVVGTAVIGRPQTVGQVWTATRPRLLPLLGLTFLYTVALGGAVLLVVVLALVDTALGVLAIAAAVVVGIWLSVLFSFAPTALVLENAGIVAAFGRSRRLVRGSWWRVFGIGLLVILIAAAVALVVSLPFLAAGDGLSFSTDMLSTRYLVWSTIGVVVASTLTEPFIAATTVLLYTDQRIRREGLAAELASVANR
jgi:hypothetical protein